MSSEISTIAVARSGGEEPSAAGVDPRILEKLAARVKPARKRRPMIVRAPATGEALGRVPRCTGEDVKRAVGRARVAQEGWSHRPLAERAEIFHRLHDLILDRQEGILDLVQLETGKARRHAFEEVADVALVARYYAGNAESILEPARRKGALPALTAAWEHHHPRGVVGLIAPWNYPLSLSVSDAIPALLAGNAVVLKPDAQTPFAALWAAELLDEAGLPPDLLQVVTGKGSVLGPPLIESVDFVSFTGSTATGRRVAVMAAERLIGCSLELGGKNAMIVLPDADIAAATAGAVRGCFTNAGQLCIAIERLFLHDEVYENFVERFVDETRLLRLGFSLDYDTDIGSLASAEQLEKVSEHVSEAVEKGAEVLVGGRARPDLGPWFYEPTILAGVTPEMAVFAEETFGPVVALYRFESVHETVEAVNASRYGLNASIWTRDVELGRRLAGRIHAGTVNINEAYAAAWASVDAPMGGYKESGLGRRHGAEGILKYTESQTVAVQRGVPLAAPAGIDEQSYSWLMTRALKGLSRVPGLR